MKKNIETLLKTTLSNAKFYETENDFLDDAENGYIELHVNEANVMAEAIGLREEFIDTLTCIEDMFDFEWELKHNYGYDLENLDSCELDDLKDTLNSLELVYIDETETYYII